MDKDSLLASLHAIHDHLHAGRVNEAHQACECALGGAPPDMGNLDVTDAAAALQFVAAFNRLCLQHRMRACTVIILPSQTDPRKVSIQIGGVVAACQILEGMMGKTSTYMGGH